MKYKSLVGLGLFFILVFGAIQWIFNSSNTCKSDIHIKTNGNIDILFKQLEDNESLRNQFSFKVAKYLMRFSSIKAGKYCITDGMSNRELINMFKYNHQKLIEFRFGNAMLPHELYGALGRKFEADSVDFEKAILNKTQLDALGLDSINVLSLFWAETYYFPWAISPKKMIRKFVNQQQIYWSAEQFNKLTKTGLKSAKEAYILASIIEKEAVKPEELPIMAGVYINRLMIDMPLQADPTLKYAIGNTTMQRVTGILNTSSPYNTYKNKGLPPGPIGIASKKGVEAVLNFKQHDFLYFCAKEDFSNTHYFTKSYAEHIKNARKYRAALDERGIK